MVIFGFFVLCIVLAIVTLVLLFVGKFGGSEFSTLPMTDMTWYIPLVVLDAYLWVLLVSHSPFTVITTQ